MEYHVNCGCVRYGPRGHKFGEYHSLYYCSLTHDFLYYLVYDGSDVSRRVPGHRMLRWDYYLSNHMESVSFGYAIQVVADFAIDVRVPCIVT